MTENEKKSAIEQIKLKLEKRLLQIEKNKKANKSSKNLTEENLSELEIKKELRELQKTLNNNFSPDKVSKDINEIQSIISNPIKKSDSNPNEVKNTIKIKAVNEKSLNQLREATKNTKEEENNNEKEVATPKSKIVKKNIKEKQLNGEVTKKENITKTSKKTVSKPPPKTKIVKKVKRPAKESTVNNRVIAIILLVFVLSFLGYLYNLKQDLIKKQEELNQIKKEQIDYSKDDRIFKDVEDDSDDPEDLQDIK